MCGYKYIRWMFYMDSMEKHDYLLNLIRRTPEIVKNNISSYKRREFHEFRQYIDEFLDNNGEERFFTLHGIRGLGKTTIIFQLYDYLINERKIDKKRVLYLDLNRLKDHNDLNLQEFFDIFITDINEEAYFKDEPLFIFINESQYADNWAMVGKIFLR